MSVPDDKWCKLCASTCMCMCVFVVLCMCVSTVAASLRACLHCSVGSVLSESSTKDSLKIGKTEKRRPSDLDREGRKRRGKKGRTSLEILLVALCTSECSPILHSFSMNKSQVYLQYINFYSTPFIRHSFPLLTRISNMLLYPLQCGHLWNFPFSFALLCLLWFSVIFIMYLVSVFWFAQTAVLAKE